MAEQAQKAQMTSGEVGDLVAVFRGRLVVVPCLVMGALAGVIVWHGATSAYAIAGTIAGAAVAAGVFLLSFRRSRQLSVQVHADGLTYRAKGTEETWAWDEIREFFVLAEEREIHGVPHGIADALLSPLLELAVKLMLPKAVKYTVRYRICRPGRQRTFDSKISGYVRLGAMIEDLVTQVQLPKALAAFGSGEAVQFGKLQLGQDGLIYASVKHPRFLPMTALARVSITRYAVKVHQTGHRLAWLTAERAAVPNAAVLVSLAERIVAGRDAPDPNEAGDRNEADARRAT